MSKVNIKVYFSDFFEVLPETLEEYGAFNVSLVADLPVFIDPFLLFTSDKPAYQALHEEIIRYLRFLRDESIRGGVPPELVSTWFRFSEVKETWLGFSKIGNQGRGLGSGFANALNRNLSTIFRDFGDSNVTKGHHLEKLSLIGSGVGRDNISDFTTNLIKGFLLDYTESFALQHLRDDQRREMSVHKVRFDYDRKVWCPKTYQLPFQYADFVVLTPRDILTRDETWINRSDLSTRIASIAQSLPDGPLRVSLNQYLESRLWPVKDETRSEREARKRKAYRDAIDRFPEIIDYYIRDREDHGDDAQSDSQSKVVETEHELIERVRARVIPALQKLGFFDVGRDTLEECRARVAYLKRFIESQGGYDLLYDEKRQPLKAEYRIQLLFRLPWFASISDVNREVNNGRGAVDYTVSRGAADKSLVEFKLASNRNLRRNLENQVAVYKVANDTKKAMTVIVYYTAIEGEKARAILADLGVATSEDFVLIDARSDNKPSASTV